MPVVSCSATSKTRKTKAELEQELDEEDATGDDEAEDEDDDYDDIGLGDLPRVKNTLFEKDTNRKNQKLSQRFVFIFRRQYYIHELIVTVDME